MAQNRFVKIKDGSFVRPDGSTETSSSRIFRMPEGTDVPGLGLAKSYDQFGYDQGQGIFKYGSPEEVKQNLGDVNLEQTSILKPQFDVPSAPAALPAAPASTAEDPAKAFALLTHELLKSAQGVDTVELLKRRRALQRAQLGKISEITPEELRTLTPEQQASIRSGKAGQYSGEIDETSYQIGQAEKRVANFEKLIEDSHKLGEEFTKNMTAPESVVDGYVKLIESGQDLSTLLSGLNDKTRQAIISKIDPLKIAQKTKEGFTLQPGESRYSAQGQLIASGGIKELAKPPSAQEYEYAKSQGYKGTFEQYQNEDANRRKPITNNYLNLLREIKYQQETGVSPGQVISARTNLPIKLTDTQSQFLSQGQTLDYLTDEIKNALTNVPTGALQGWVTEKGYTIPVIQNKFVNDSAVLDLMQKMYAMNNLFVYFSTGKQLNETEFDRLAKQTPNFKATSAYNKSAVTNFSNNIQKRLDSYLKVNGWKFAEGENTASTESKLSDEEAYKLYQSQKKSKNNVIL